jgi:hypothetical protein
MTCTGGTNGAIDGCGMSKGEINGAAEMVGLVYFADICFSLYAPIKQVRPSPEFERFLSPTLALVAGSSE